MFLGSLAVLSATGWGADRSSWYSPAAAALPLRGPDHYATLWVRGVVATITPAWIHPSLFWRMPPGELVAALVAPLAAVALAAALFGLIVRLPIGAPGRMNTALATTAFGTMFLSVVAAGRWLVDHPYAEGTARLPARSDPLAPGHTGWVVGVLLVALAAVALMGLRLVLRRGPEEPAHGSDAVA